MSALQDPLPVPTQDQLPLDHPPIANEPILPEEPDHWVHDLDPVCFSIPGLDFPVRYYSLSYLLGVVLAMWLLQWLGRRRRILIGPQAASDLTLMYGILGIIIGGRLGWVLFYGIHNHSFSDDPFWPFKIWKGGMASHGGMIGVAGAMYLFSRVHRVPFVHVLDCVAIAAPIGLCLGRIANFINGELWGKPSDVSWAVIFGETDPDAGWIARHPSQLYEAAGEGLILFLILFCLHRRLLPRIGASSAIFCLVYSAARIVCERFRQEDSGLERETQFLGLTRGEQLTFALLAFGLFLAVGAARARFGRLPPPEANEAEPQPEGRGS